MVTSDPATNVFTRLLEIGKIDNGRATHKVIAAVLEQPPFFRAEELPMKRKPQRKLQHESLEDRIYLTASAGWDGPGLGSATLTYSVGQAPAELGQDVFESTVEAALKTWSDVADINFVETSRTGLRDSIDFTFKNIDGGGSVLAQAYFPDDVNPSRIAGDVQFDSAETWEVGNARGGRATDLMWVAVHEIGHALGLNHEHEHDHDSDAVMHASVSPHQSFQGLDAADVDSVLELYAPAKGRTVDTGTPLAKPTVTPITPSNLIPPTSRTPLTPVSPRSSDVPDSDVGSGDADNDVGSDVDETNTDQGSRRRWVRPGWRWVSNSPWRNFRFFRVNPWSRFTSGTDTGDPLPGQTEGDDGAADAGNEEAGTRTTRTWVFRFRPGRVLRWRV